MKRLMMAAVLAALGAVSARADELDDAAAQVGAENGVSIQRQVGARCHCFDVFGAGGENLGRIDVPPNPSWAPGALRAHFADRLRGLSPILWANPPFPVTISPEAAAALRGASMSRVRGNGAVLATLNQDLSFDQNTASVAVDVIRGNNLGIQVTSMNRDGGRDVAQIVGGQFTTLTSFDPHGRLIPRF